MSGQEADPVESAAMRVLLVHNHYQQRGGEDGVFDRESSLLQARGHKVLKFVKDNRDLNGTPGWRLAAETFWSRRSKAEVENLVRKHRPDVAHFHNTLPLISPAAYYSVRAQGVPVIQTLHNFRHMCPNGLLFRDGRICELCVKKAFAWPGALYGCYRNSRGASVTVASSTALHRALGTWKKTVTRYIALSEFAKSKFIEGGLSERQISVKPNFVADTGLSGAAAGVPREGALYVGRLSAEKGLETLIDAWRGLDVPLRILGDGPMRKRLCDSGVPHIQLLGNGSQDEVAAEMSRASFLVLPSVWYEGLPLVLIEAFCQGLPVLASGLGSMAEIVEDGVTGLHFIPGRSHDLAAKVRWAHAHPSEMLRMGANARDAYQRKYTPEMNYRQLMAIYRQAVEENRGHRLQAGR